MNVSGMTGTEIFLVMTVAAALDLCLFELSASELSIYIHEMNANSNMLSIEEMVMPIRLDPHSS